MGKKRLHETAGKSIIQMLWDELDTVVCRIMSGDGAAEDGRDPGRAEGIATSIAIMTNPYQPSLDAIREEAMSRYYDGGRGTKRSQARAKAAVRRTPRRQDAEAAGRRRHPDVEYGL